MEINPEIYNLDAASFLVMASSVYDSYEKWFLSNSIDIIDGAMPFYQENELIGVDLPLTFGDLINLKEG